MRRPKPHRGLGGARPLVLLLALVVIALAGCGEDGDDSVCAPESSGGRIEGMVRSAGGPLEARIEAQGFREPGLRERRFQTTTKSGAYSIDLPAGRYHLIAQVPDVGSYRYVRSGELLWDPSDTLIVDRDSRIVADFDFGALGLDCTIDPSFDGDEAIITLYARDPSERDRSVTSMMVSVQGLKVTCLFRALAPESYRICVDLGPNHERIWMPGHHEMTKGWWYEVPPRHTAEVIGEIGTRRARIEGEIVGAWTELGTSRPYVIPVSAETEEAVQDPRQVQASGEFRIDLAIPESVKLKVAAGPDGTIQQWIGGASFEEAQTFDLEPGETVSGIRFVDCGVRLDVSPPERSFVVSFHDLATRACVAQWAHGPGWPPGTRFGIPNLRAGTYLIRIDPYRAGSQAWCGQWFDGATEIEQAQPVALHNPGDIATVSVVLEEGGVIRGNVLGLEETKPFGSFSKVRVTPAGEPTIWAQRTVDGIFPAFEFLGVPDGLWKVGASDPDSAERVLWFPGTDDWEQAEPIEIRDASEVSGVVIDFAAGPGPRIQ